jgi:copper ion binding protein
MTTSTYSVTGMTCAHCANAVTEEVGKISGVLEVAVNVAAGSVTVTSEGALSGTAFADAIEEAGYEVAAA